MPRAAINAAFTHGMDPAYVESYRDHYVSMNPWMDFWTAAPSGEVRISERDSPSRAFRHTEFYNDWLAPQGNLGAAVGMRLDVGRNDTVVVAWHYDQGMAGRRYDAAGAATLERLAPGMAEAVCAAGLLRDGLEAGLRLGPLMESIDGAAFLVDRDRRIREANREAAAALQQGTVLGAAANVLAMRDQAMQRWLEEAVARLADGQPLSSPTAAFGLDERVFSVSLARAPEHAETGFALLVRPRPRVLVVVRLLAGGPARVDSTALRFAYGLSAAEIRLCEVLLNGRSLAEATEILGVSDGTVRQRVKMIFHKTRTHRQGELIALLARFGAGSWAAEETQQDDRLPFGSR